MKKIIKLTVPTFGRACSKLCFGTALITIILITINLSAQTPPPPNGGETPEQSGSTPVGGGGAPIGGGLLILVALGAGYGAKKVYDFKNQK